MIRHKGTSSVSAQIAGAAADLEAVAASCAGPSGTTKLLVQGTDATSGTPDIILTTSSKRLLEHKHLLSSSRFADIILELTGRQHEECGDGGLRALHFASSLTIAAIRSNVHHVHVSEAFSNAARWLAEWLREAPDNEARSKQTALEQHFKLAALRNISWANLAEASAMVVCMLQAKPLIVRRCTSANTTLALLANLTLSCFVASLHASDPKNAAAPTGAGGGDGIAKSHLVPDIRFLTWVGPQLGESEACLGMLFLDLPTLPRLLRHDQYRDKARNDGDFCAEAGDGDDSGEVLAVALFDVALEAPSSVLPGLQLGASIVLEKKSTPSHATPPAQPLPPPLSFSPPSPRSPAAPPPLASVSSSSSSSPSTSPSPSWVLAGPKDYERELLSRLRDALVRLGVGVVGCQRVVHPWLHRELESKGVVVLPRLSLRHMDAVRSLSGAKVLSDVMDLAMATTTTKATIRTTTTNKTTTTTTTTVGGAVNSPPPPMSHSSDGGSSGGDGEGGSSPQILGALKRPRLRVVGKSTLVVLEAPSDQAVSSLGTKLLGKGENQDGGGGVRGGGGESGSSSSSSSSGGGSTGGPNAAHDDGGGGGGVSTNAPPPYQERARERRIIEEFTLGVLRRRRPLATFIVCAPDTQAAAECAAVLQGAVTALSLALPGTPGGAPAVLAGAGRWEAAALAVLRNRIDLFSSSSASSSSSSPPGLPRRNKPAPAQKPSSARVEKRGEQRRDGGASGVDMGKGCVLGCDGSEDKAQAVRRGLELFAHSFENVARMRCGARAWARANTDVAAAAVAWSNGVVDPEALSRNGNKLVLFADLPAEEIGPIESFSAAMRAVERSVHAANCAMRIRVTAAM